MYAMVYVLYVLDVFTRTKPKQSQVLRRLPRRGNIGTMMREALTHREATASLERLRHIFSMPLAGNAALLKIEAEISTNLLEFLRNKIVADRIEPRELEDFFRDFRIPDAPMFVSEQAEYLLQTAVRHAVNTAAPKFIGHMTSSLPSFMLPLTKIMTALNQNMVKTETSKSFTPLERQVIAMLHHLIYRCPTQFYQATLHDSSTALGAFCSGGTVANITALWAARNTLLASPAGGVREIGVSAALQQQGLQGMAVLVSHLGHYSLAKAADLLGIGRNALIAVATDNHNRIDCKALRAHLRRLRARKIGIVAIIGIAGSTETGSIDPLPELAKIAAGEGCHLHVDAAWGGATLFSDRHRQLLRGIELADSVTIDAHKQLYVPMGVGMLLCRTATTLRDIEQQANYIVRAGSRDQGKYTLEGSRPGMALLVHSSLRVFGRTGFELLIDYGIEQAMRFAEIIAATTNFELVTLPQLNILTYRFNPRHLRSQHDDANAYNKFLNRLNIALQRKQRRCGTSFVSRTTLRVAAYQLPIVVLRAVLANPLTTATHLQEVIAEQEAIGQTLLQEEIATIPRDTTAARLHAVPH